MNLSRLFGTFKIKIEGFDAGLIISKLTNICTDISLYTSDEAVYASISIFDIKKVKSLCEKQGYYFEIVSENGIYFTFKKRFKRYGIIIGAAACAVMIFILSNIALKIRIVGADDPEIQSQIIELAAQEGVKAGAYIPSLNFLKIEARLMELSDDISWVSIGHSGPVITVNVSLATRRVESMEGRIPCNIVAKRDGVIVKADVLSGEFSSLIGSAVKEGELLVSGIVENSNGNVYYYHSIASIIAEYEETVEFEQRLYDTVISDGETTYGRYLSVFDLDIPISTTRPPNENYTVETVSVPVKLFGITLPISIKTVEYTTHVTKVKSYSQTEAQNVLLERLEAYQENILDNQEIVSREVYFSLEDDVVKLKALYKLRGDIGVESPIFVK